MFIFVYGTLKRGHGNHRLLRDSRFVAEATVGGMELVDLGGFPAMRPATGWRPAVAGEVYEVADPLVLAQLDRLEGHPRWYERRELAVRDLNGRRFYRVEGYVMEQAQGAPLKSGRWPEEEQEACES